MVAVDVADRGAHRVGGVGNFPKRPRWLVVVVWWLWLVVVVWWLWLVVVVWWLWLVVVVWWLIAVVCGMAGHRSPSMIKVPKVSRDFPYAINIENTPDNQPEKTSRNRTPVRPVKENTS
ncbi:hypothetical protein ACN4D8_05725 [Corynebacterium macclintockiae]|uniref:hypothetical protein n=1 Tax=Corynebacterium macclintockiae TaxID=2913501 RepID=UPI003EBE9D9F